MPQGSVAIADPRFSPGAPGLDPRPAVAHSVFSARGKGEKWAGRERQIALVPFSWMWHHAGCRLWPGEGEGRTDANPNRKTAKLKLPTPNSDPVPRRWNWQKSAAWGCAAGLLAAVGIQVCQLVLWDNFHAVVPG